VPLGGLPPSSGPLAGGYYVTPTVLVNVRNSWRIAQEEIFGPVVCAIPWEDEDDVLAQANDTRYGLSAFVWDTRPSRGLRSAHRVKRGLGASQTRAAAKCLASLTAGTSAAAWDGSSR